MLRPRLIPLLLLDGHRLVKTLNFRKPAYVGDPVNVIKIFNEKEVDEIHIADINASLHRKPIDLAYIKKLATECFMPLTYSGGIRTLTDAKALFDAGVDKLCLSSAAILHSDLIGELVSIYGSQSVSVCINCKRRSKDTYSVYDSSRKRVTRTRLDEYIIGLQESGVGELLIQSVDAEGTLLGPDLSLLVRASSLSNVPIIYSGGISSLFDCQQCLSLGASGIAAGSFFVYQGPHKAVLISYPSSDMIKQLRSSYQMNPITPPHHRRCTRCIMDTTAPNIIFYEDGTCNFCTDFLANSLPTVSEKPASKAGRLENLLKRIRRTSLKDTYDCIVGLSGGVDSSWTLVQAIKLGLKPLAVHMDNGWDSELAQNNIANLVKSLNVDLVSYVIEWSEYKSLMQAFLDANVVDVELLYDNAMLGACYDAARQRGIKYILGGHNQATEGITMPQGWNWYKRDVLNIKSIARKHGGIKIKSMPVHSTLDYLRDQFILGIHWINFLDYFAYIKEDALNVLQHDYGYKPYPYKHYESIFTRFYQGHILPVKFHIDKRLVHLSSLILSGQLSRDDALLKISEDPYPSQSDLELDTKYFLKKMDWQNDQLKHYLSSPPRSHTLYRSERQIYTRLLNFGRTWPLKTILKRLISR